MDIFKAVFWRDIKIKDGRECSKSQDNLSGKNKTFNKGNEKKERERVHLINWKSRIFLESRRRSIEFFRAIHEQSTRAPGWVYFLPTLPRIPPTILLSTFDNFQGNLIIEGRDITCPAARSNEKRSTKNGSRYWKRYVFLRRHVKNFHPRSPGCALAKFHQIAR